ncbi:DMT family transporter [Curvivirga aplysinae]|uniref:DMT family transporter n=1 Tax=Curvivirga aplysinae TaxID=2529852 RepID=UPI0012BC6C92|nr:DMT family transporter [Curvivirga aplysinae]MTI09830.1 DMT family transporter [Curvivirga aplysinae]
MDQLQHRKGLLITLIGVLVLTPDSLLFFLANVDPFEMIFWRGLFQGTALTIGFAFVYKDQFFPMVKAIGKTGILVSLSFAICNISFVYSLALTGAANTLICVATSSMWAALFSFLIMKERVRPVTLVAMIFAFIGIIVVFMDDFGSADLSQNLFGIATAITLALSFTLIRKKSHVNMLPTSAISAFMGAIIAVSFLYRIDYEASQWIYMAIMGFVVVPLSFACLAIGPRYIPAAEVSLLMLLETVLGPIWVWIGIGTEPHTNEIYGGAIVVGTLLIHSLYRLKFPRKKAAA